MATIGPIDNDQLLSTTNNVQFATLGVGVAPATADVKISAGNRIGAWITGTNISAGSDADGLFVDTSFAPSVSITNAAAIGLYPTMNPGGGVTITTGYGLYIASGTKGGAGAVTTGYGIYVTAPTIATTNITAQLDNIRLDSNIIQATNANGTLDVNSAGTGALSLGTNATSHQVTVGSVSGTSSTTLQSGSGALAVTSTNGTLTINSGTGALGISTDASATTLSIGTGGAVKGVTVGSTNSTSATTVQSGSGALNVTSTNGALTVNSGTGALGISTDASATTVSLATGGAVKTVTLGSTNSTSATTVQSGSGALNVTATNGALTINSGTGALGISTDASATTVSLATGGAVKTVTLGSTNTTSSTAIKSGSGNVVINSGLTIDSSGRNTNGTQPCFLAYLSSSDTNVTGDGTVYQVAFDTVVFDQGSNFTTGASAQFTAPKTGKYLLSANIFWSIGVVGTNTYVVTIAATSRSVKTIFTPSTGQNGSFSATAIIDMTAADTVHVNFTASGGTKTTAVVGSGSPYETFFSGYLIC